MKKLCIVGTGGFAKEVASYLMEDSVHGNFSIDCFLDIQEKDDIMGLKVMPMSYLDITQHTVCVAVGHSQVRKNIVNQLPTNTEYANIVHKNTSIGRRVSFGKGAIVCPFSVVTVFVSIGNFCLLNCNTTVGHETTIGDYFTASPGVNLSGNCKIGDVVYLGTNSSVKEKITIGDDVVVGSNACVVKDAIIRGTYVGVPAKMIG